MPTPNPPPEWVQQALRAEVKAAFGADAVLSFTEGRAAVVVTAGTPRFPLPVLLSAFGDTIAAGDELELELFWQPIDAPERAAQQSAYGRVIDYQAFAAQTAPLYRAWRFAMSHFPFGSIALQSAQWDERGLTIQASGHTLVFPLSEWFAGEISQAPFGRAVRAKLEAEGLLASECKAPTDWFARFRQEYLSFTRELIFATDQAARGRVNVEVLCQQDDSDFVADQFRTAVLWQDANEKLHSVEAGIDRPMMPALMHREVDGVKLVVAPFRWNRCPVTVLGIQALEERFNVWFARWLEGNQSPDGKTLLGVINSAGRPTSLPHGLGLTFTVNFGSAPVEAVAELISVLARGAQLVALGAEPNELSCGEAGESKIEFSAPT